MKRVMISVMVLFISVGAFAQANGSSYQTAIGVKFYPGAISVKHFTQSNRALEGLGYFWNYGFRFTGLYEFHGDIQGAKGLKWYAGPGAHVGFWNDDWKNRYPDRDRGVAIGIDGVLGLDYKISGAPLNISIDWQPSFNLVGYSYFESGWGGVGIRYTIK
ncbi:MAG: hypothetical protein K2P88_11200 [Chitinophagaceae bacterium]|uniref:hypothetical protein n=1 Tax=unclassified Paraflavitalea TaxID=2798305 RepID=UPI003D35556C|nr:hypothetical protein [Chitinophagaceae bacterium]